MQTQQIHFHNIMMVSLFNMINVNEGSSHSPLKFKVWMEKGTNWNTVGRFLQLHWVVFQAMFAKLRNQFLYGSKSVKMVTACVDKVFLSVMTKNLQNLIPRLVKAC